MLGFASLYPAYPALLYPAYPAALYLAYDRLIPNRFIRCHSDLRLIPNPSAVA
jgi:hypothetical protein